MSRDRDKSTTHEAFGKVNIVRTSGQANLFGVDWPTGHFMTLTVSEAELLDDGVHKRTHAGREVIKIHLSDVQFAQLITGVGTEGVPCTIGRRWVFTELGPRYRSMEEPPSERDEQEAKRHSDTIANKAREAMAEVDVALAQVNAMLSGGPPKKGDLQRVRESLERARREATANLPYIVEAASEVVTQQQEKAKGEIEAYLGHAMQKLGERTFAAAAAVAIEQGRDPLALLEGPLAPAEEIVGEVVSSTAEERVRKHYPDAGVYKGRAPHRYEVKRNISATESLGGGATVKDAWADADRRMVQG